MGVELRDERKVVTVLFADLVGSTALGERLDPEELRLVVGDGIARIVAEVERLGGRVKDLAGDGVLAFFGAPVTSEDDPERAVRAGIRIAEELASYAEEVRRSFGQEGFGVRVGIGTGPVVVGELTAGPRVEYAAFGDSVNTAARLQASARPGAVLVDADTRRLAGTAFTWGEPVELELKGKTGTVLAYEVRGLRTGHRRGREAADLDIRLVGRDAELAAAVSLLDGLHTGVGGVVFITGEPGIGKSRLLAELRERLDGRWLEGRCVSYGESLPYWPFRELLRDWLGLGADEPELRARIALRRNLEHLHGEQAATRYPYLGSLLGLALDAESAARLAELSPEALQYRTFEVVIELVGRLAADGPLVLALEDLHWADATSVQLAERLLGLTESAALLIAVTQRSERDLPSWHLKELAAREYPHLMRELALEPLSRQAEFELLHDLVGQGTLPAGLEGRLLEVAEGNPFFLQELVRSLADAGALVREGREWRFDHEAPVEVPQTVEKVVLARLDRLDPECRRVITAASALGRRFGLALLEGVLGNGEVSGVLHELQRADLVRTERRWPQPQYRFKHGLIQEVAYRTLVSATRTGLHRRAAEWLENRPADNLGDALGLLAHHWLAAGDEDRAVDYLVRAGDRARQEYALDEAVGHYRELLPLLERRGAGQEMALILFKLALALHTSLRFAEADAAYQQAFALWRPPPPVAAAKPLRVAANVLPGDPDPHSAITWVNIQLGMQLFDRLVEAWPERTIVPSLAERWEIAADGLRYLFHLHAGLRWSDGHPLTAHDVEFGIKRVLDPGRPGASAAIYFVLENGLDYYAGRERDHRRVGVAALDERTVEFRLEAPAPYFLSVLNRPDAGPQPRHAIERDGEEWTQPRRQVVSGPFRQQESGPERVVLVRREDYDRPRRGNVAYVEMTRLAPGEDLLPYQRGDLDLILARYSSRPRGSGPSGPPAEQMGPGAGAFYLAFDHRDRWISNVHLRRALARAIDRSALAHEVPANAVVATGGLVPPALQGHTPDIALPYDPQLAREELARGAPPGRLVLAAVPRECALAEALTAQWRDVLGIDAAASVWSAEEAARLGRPWGTANATITAWLPGYPDPEYYLRLLLHSQSKTNEGGFSYAPFDQLIERARREGDGRVRLELFHQADRMAVADQVALIPIYYLRGLAYVQPWVEGWWEFGKSCASLADLTSQPPHEPGVRGRDPGDSPVPGEFALWRTRDA
jgi:ABC-type oligopeptide transport system substrate-binding subunit/class 3 adenylate cyclase